MVCAARSDCVTAIPGGSRTYPEIGPNLWPKICQLPILRMRLRMPSHKASRACVPVAKLVALLAEYDLVNEPAGLRIRARQPWGRDRRKTSSKRFQEGHEIPHGEYMRLEKNPQVLDVSDLTIKWMVHKALARRGNNLEKARNRSRLSWHMISMQQAGPGHPNLWPR